MAIRSKTVVFPNNFEWFLMKTLSFWNIGRIHFQIPKNKNRSQRLSQKIEVCLICRDNGAKRLNFVGLQRRMLPNIPGRSWNPNDERVIWSLVGVKIPSQLLWRLGLIVSSHTSVMLLQSLVEGLQQQQNVGLLSGDIIHPYSRLFTILDQSDKFYLKWKSCALKERKTPWALNQHNSFTAADASLQKLNWIHNKR